MTATHRETGRPRCGKGLHLLDVEGATYRRGDGRVGCVACKRDRAKRSRQRAKEKKATQQAATEAAKAKAAEETPALNPAGVLPAGVSAGLVSGETAARYRLALLVRTARERT